MWYAWVSVLLCVAVCALLQASQYGKELEVIFQLGSSKKVATYQLGENMGAVYRRSYIVIS
jgi:hypothetical protein